MSKRSVIRFLKKVIARFEHPARMKRAERTATNGCPALNKNERCSLMSEIIVGGKPFRGQDLTGQKFTRLLVLRFLVRDYSPNKTARYWWECKCDCGNIITVEGAQLRRGATTSCKCLGAEKTSQRSLVHGESGSKRSPIYKAWLGMCSRCRSKEPEKSKNYLLRGITVCDRWKNFLLFKQDMEPDYKSGLTLDRKNNDLGYSPDNCRWATASEQQNNKTTTIFLTLNGKTMPLSHWSKETGLSCQVITGRLDRGWPIEYALTAKPDRRPLCTRLAEHAGHVGT